MIRGLRRPLRAAALLLAAAFTLHAFAATTAPAPDDAPPFQIERSHVHTLASPTLGRSYQLYVKLPPGYDKPENAQRRYPVVWLTDGPYTFQVASGETRVPFNQGSFEEFILVGLSYAQGEEPAQSRERDLTPFPDIRDKPYPTGGAPTYLDFLKNEAMPLIEATYRIDPAQRTLAGQSYGGLFGLWVLFTEPQLFRNYVLTSASLWYNRRAIFALETKFAERHKDLIANVWFAIGANEHPAPCGRQPGECPDNDMVADQAAMAKALRSRRYRSLKVHTKIVDGAHHTTTFPVGLLWAMQDLFLTHKLETR
jgi:predicted alpha/beta superfamily hydrolase